MGVTIGLDTNSFLPPFALLCVTICFHFVYAAADEQHRELLNISLTALKTREREKAIEKKKGRNR